MESGVSRAVYQPANSGEIAFDISFEVTDLVFSDTTGSGATTTSVAAVIDFSWLQDYFESSDWDQGISITVTGSYQAGGTVVAFPLTGSGQLIHPTWNNVPLDVAHSFAMAIHWETGNVGVGSESGLLRAQLADIPFILSPGITANSAEMNVVDNSFTPIPEPSTAVFLAGGLIGLAARRGNRADCV